MYSRTIISVSLPYAWQEAVKFIRKSSHEIKFGGGSEIKHAVDSGVQIFLDEHAVQDALNHIVHPSDPFCTDSNGKPSENKICAYIKEYEKNFDSSVFSYTYRKELEEAFIVEESNSGYPTAVPTKYLNQITKLREGLKKQIDEDLPSNRNIAILYNPLKWGMDSASPCWCILWIRLERIDDDGTVWVSVCTFYRSHDLTDAWESNFIAQVTMIVKEILEPLKAKILFWHENNASLHIYKHNLPVANAIKEISVSPQLRRLQEKYDSICRR